MERMPRKFRLLSPLLCFSLRNVYIWLFSSSQTHVTWRHLWNGSILKYLSARIIQEANCELQGTDMNDLKHNRFSLWFSLQFHDGVYLIFLLGLLEGFFVPLYQFYITPSSKEQKVGTCSTESMIKLQWKYNGLTVSSTQVLQGWQWGFAYVSHSFRRWNQASRTWCKIKPILLSWGWGIFNFSSLCYKLHCGGDFLRLSHDLEVLSVASM